MNLSPVRRRTLALLAVVVPLAVLFVYVALRSGPLAPVPVTVAQVTSRAVKPALSGLGTVEARYQYKIGPTAAGRILSLDVQVGDVVQAGQLLGVMDPVDLDDRILAQQAALEGARAKLKLAQAEQSFARTQAERYRKLLAVHGTSQEVALTKRQELDTATAQLDAARDEVDRAQADLRALEARHQHLELKAPVAGLVVARQAEPGSTVVAGQSVIELVDPAQLWVDARFEQINAEGLAPGLPAKVRLRSRQGQELTGHVLRVEPLADSVTEETLAKIVFDATPVPLPPLGELAEVTVQLDAGPAAPTIPNAAIRMQGEEQGAWQYVDGRLDFTPLTLGPADLTGHVQIYKGLRAGDRVVVYSDSKLSPDSRVHVVDQIDGIKP